MTHFSSSSDAIDPFIFEKGASPTVEVLRALGGETGSSVALREALHQYLDSYVAVSAPDLERLFYAGERCKKAGLMQADLWSVDWIRSLAADLHVRGGNMLVAFLSGFYDEMAEERLVEIRRHLDALSQQQTQAAETIDSDFAVLQESVSSV